MNKTVEVLIGLEYIRENPKSSSFTTIIFDNLHSSIDKWLETASMDSGLNITFKIKE